MIQPQHILIFLKVSDLEELLLNPLQKLLKNDLKTFKVTQNQNMGRVVDFKLGEQKTI